MSATRYKKPHVDILICIEMTRERNLGIKKNTRYSVSSFTTSVRILAVLTSDSLIALCDVSVSY